MPVQVDSPTGRGRQRLRRVCSVLAVIALATVATPGPTATADNGLSPASDDELTNQSSTTHLINHQSLLDTQGTNHERPIALPARDDTIAGLIVSS